MNTNLNIYEESFSQFFPQQINGQNVFVCEEQQRKVWEAQRTSVVASNVPSGSFCYPGEKRFIPDGVEFVFTNYPSFIASPVLQQSSITALQAMQLDVPKNNNFILSFHKNIGTSTDDLTLKGFTQVPASQALPDFTNIARFSLRTQTDFEEATSSKIVVDKACITNNVKQLVIKNRKASQTLNDEEEGCSCESLKTEEQGVQCDPQDESTSPSTSDDETSKKGKRSPRKNKKKPEKMQDSSSSSSESNSETIKSKKKVRFKRKQVLKGESSSS